MSALLEHVTFSTPQSAAQQRFDALYTEHHERIFNFIYRMNVCVSDAQDWAADTFVKAWQKLPEALAAEERDGSFGWQAWLYRIAHNRAMDEFRHRRLIYWENWDTYTATFHTSQIAPDRPDQEAERREEREEVQALLGKMHPQYRTVMVLRVYQDLSYDEMAEVLNTTRAAIKSLLYRAREELRQLYNNAERAHARQESLPAKTRGGVWPPEMRRRGRALCNLGMAHRQVALLLGVPRNTVDDWARSAA